MCSLNDKFTKLPTSPLLIPKEDVIEVLELRFGKISPEIIDKITQINDPAKLKELLKKGIQTKEIDSFGFIC